MSGTNTNKQSDTKIPVMLNGRLCNLLDLMIRKYNITVIKRDYVLEKHCFVRGGSWSYKQHKNKSNN